MQKSNVIAVSSTVLLASVLLVGCSGTAGSTSRPSDPSARADAGVAIAECMRGKGHEYEDPAQGDTAEVAIPDGVDAAAYSRDLDACIAEHGDHSAGDAQEAPDAREKAVESAQCIRERGFPDFPDDQDGQRRYRPSDQQIFDSAAKACDEEVYGKDGFASVG